MTEIEVLALAGIELVACDPDTDEVALMMVVDPDESVVATGVDDATMVVATLELATNEVDSVVLVLSTKIKLSERCLTG